MICIPDRVHWTALPITIWASDYLQRHDKRQRDTTHEMPDTEEGGKGDADKRFKRTWEFMRTWEGDLIIDVSSCQQLVLL